MPVTLRNLLKRKKYADLSDEEKMALENKNPFNIQTAVSKIEKVKKKKKKEMDEALSAMY